MALPILHYDTSGLPERRAFDEWRALMAPMFEVSQASYSDRLPRGSATSFLLGEIIANRCTFNAQHLRRDRDRIAATPHHLLLQMYRSGGFTGEMRGRPVTIARGQVAVTDLRHPLDVRAATSDTTGVAIPRHLLDGIDLDGLPPRLDPPRNRRLANGIAMLLRRLPRLADHEVAGVTADFLAFVRGVLASPPSGGPPAPETDLGLRERAEAIVEERLGSETLSPGDMAAALGASRAALYRAFAPLGGVMRHIGERRLALLHDALSDPLETRSLAQLAKDFGFGSPALLSRSVRARFGVTPRDLRDETLRRGREARQTGPEPVRRWWWASETGRTD